MTSPAPPIDPNPGPWIISRDWRRCTKCYGAAAVAIDENKIVARCKNPACGNVNEGTLHERKETHACVRCGFARQVVVTYPREGYTDREPRWRKNCEACELEVSAATHLHWARSFAERAKKIRTERAANTGGKS